MCGICGVIGAKAPEAVAAMVAALRHRGPNDHGIEELPNATFGMTRLSIQDTSQAGHQPMTNENRDIWIVYNGELYNAPAQRERLASMGQNFFSHSDTEIILRLYERYGDAFLDHIVGIFALAIVDLRRGADRPRYLLARDPLGVKPLLYREAGGELVFASEIKAILAAGKSERRIDPVALRSLMMRGSVYQPRTLLRDVKMLEPAHLLVHEGGVSTVRRYWSLSVDRRDDWRRMDYSEQVVAYRGLMDEVLQSQLISDVPLGAFLSGGVDSASLVALMAQHAGNRVKTFSVGFGAELRGMDETQLAGQIAQHLGTDHTRVVVTGEEVADEFEQIVDALDQPSVDGLNTYLVSRAAAQSITVAISGTGGDDLFMGYPWHANMLAGGEGAEGFLGRYGAFNAQFHNCFSDHDVGQLIHPDLRTEAMVPATDDLEPTDELAAADTPERMTALTLRGYTNNQLLRDIDVTSMAHSLEVRVPFLDPRMIDAVLSLPGSAKLSKPIPDNPMRNSYKDSGIKRILIDAARPYLPVGFDTVPKRGFGMPLQHWIRGPLRSQADHWLSPERLSSSGALDANAMPILWQTFQQDRLNGWRAWLLMVLSRWMHRHAITA
jgi:asparagine synthase (glutamine-hydrolysing)